MLQLFLFLLFCCLCRWRHSRRSFCELILIHVKQDTRFPELFASAGGSGAGDNGGPALLRPGLPAADHHLRSRHTGATSQVPSHGFRVYPKDVLPIYRKQLLLQNHSHALKGAVLFLDSDALLPVEPCSLTARLVLIGRSGEAFICRKLWLGSTWELSHLIGAKAGVCSTMCTLSP